MPPKDSNGLALSVIAIAGFQLLQAWNNNAPSLKEVREAAPGDPTIKRQLLDADILVGGTAIILGTTVAYLTGNKTALIVMLAIFGSSSLFHHVVLNQRELG